LPYRAYAQWAVIDRTVGLSPELSPQLPSVKVSQKA
jgi:hypothetical protein